jgi:hypothetical protein
MAVMTEGAAARLTALTRELRTLKAQVARDLWRMGARLNEVRAEALYEAGGYPSFASWCAAELDLSSRTAARAIRIHMTFAEPVAEQQGIDKLEAIAGYLAVTPKEELPGDVFQLEVRLRDTDGRFFRKPIRQATTAEVREATALLKAVRAPKVARDWRDRARDWSGKLPGKGSNRVAVRADERGEPVFSFRSVPKEGLRELAAQIQAFLEEQDRGGPSAS